jgi:hypothetical protein
MNAELREAIRERSETFIGGALGGALGRAVEELATAMFSLSRRNADGTFNSRGREHLQGRLVVAAGAAVAARVLAEGRGVTVDSVLDNADAALRHSEDGEGAFLHSPTVVAALDSGDLVEGDTWTATLLAMADSLKGLGEAVRTVSEGTEEQTQASLDEAIQAVIGAAERIW